MYNIDDIEPNFYELVDMWIERPNPNTSKDLNYVYLHNEKYKNFDIANMLLYRLTLTDDRIESFEDYVKFFEYYSTLNDYDKNVYVKVLCTKLVLDIAKSNYYMLNLYKNKYNEVKIPVKAPIEYEEYPAGKFDGTILPGYEKKWRRKTIKNREKAEKLSNKGKTSRAEKILLKNIKKYGDIYSVEDLGLLYKSMGRHEDAIKYFEIAKDYTNDKDFIESRHEYYLLTEEKRFNKHIELANQSKNEKEELDHLYNAYKINHVRNNIGLRIAKILLEPGTKLTNPELAKQFLDYHLNWIVGIDRRDKSDEFFSYYAKLLYNGSLIKQDRLLAYFCYTCVRNKDEELKNIFNKYTEGELTRTYNKLKQKFLEDSKNSRENHKKEEQSIEEQKLMESLLEIERKSLKNIFNLDPDYKDFAPKSFIENYENYNKKLEYYKKALESKEEKTIVSNLEKAGKLWHRKAMVVLFYYYKKKEKIDKMYYWFFKALNALPYLDEIRRIKADVPINLPAILKYFSSNDDDPKCKEFIEDNYDFEDDLSEEVIKEFEKYSKNNFFIKKCLQTYYSTHNVNKDIDNIYELATMDVDYDDKVKYIISYIDKMGGLEAEFDDKFVEFILDSKLDKNKYVMYHRARLYNDEKLCKKYNLATSPSKVFNILNKASENKTLKVEGLNEKVDMWLGNCYEFGIGVSMDLEKASYLYSPYKKDGKGSLYMFNHFALPEMFNLKNFHKIKERFLQDIKIEDYKSTFETVKKFYDLGFSFSEVFDNDGTYIGDKNYYKVIEKEQEIERKRQEEIKKEQERIRLEAEKRRLEELERQEKERKRLEEIKRKQEEKERELKVRERELKEKELLNKQSANNISSLNNAKTTNSTNSSVNNTNSNNITINPTKNTSTKSANERLKEVREKYNKPIEPVRPDKDYNDGLTYKQRVRTYGYDYKVMMKEYNEKFKLYNKEKDNYLIRLKQAYASINSDEIEDFYKIYNTKPDRIMTYSGFEYQCQRLINDKFSISASLELDKIDLEYSDTYYLERNLASLPCYVDTLVLRLKYGTYASDVQGYAGRESYFFTDAMQRFEDSGLSEFITWSEFSSTSNEIGFALHERDKEEKSTDYQRGKAYIKNRIREIVLPIFKTHTIIYSKSVGFNCTIDVVPKNIKIIFELPSLYD